MAKREHYAFAFMCMLGAVAVLAAMFAGWAFVAGFAGIWYGCWTAGWFCESRAAAVSHESSEP